MRRILGNSVIDFNPIICLPRTVARAKTVSGIANAKTIVANGSDLLPGTIVFFDVETTGLYSRDRMLSFAAIKNLTGSYNKKTLELACMNLIF